MGLPQRGPVGVVGSVRWPFVIGSALRQGFVAAYRWEDYVDLVTIRCSSLPDRAGIDSIMANVGCVDKG
jgi:hypothetical protein